MKYTLLIPISLFIAFSCQKPKTKEEATEKVTNPFTGKNPWPEIRKKRINQLLPNAMDRAKVDAWVVICREKNNDPMALHIGGENAGGTSSFVFYKEGMTVKSVVLSSFGEVTALKDLGLHDSIVSVSRGQDVFQLASAFI